MAYYRSKKKARKPLPKINHDGSMLSRLSTGTKLYKEIKEIRDILTTGVVIAIDPSCGSASSMPGWAVYRLGFLADSGTIELPVGASLQHRLQILAVCLQEISKKYLPAVLIYEDVPAVRFHASGRTSSGSQASLLKAVGVVLATAGPIEGVGLSPRVWRRLVSASYVKSDQGDAIEMGLIAINIAKEIQNDIATKKKEREERGRGRAGNGTKRRASKSNVPARS